MNGANLTNSNRTEVEDFKVSRILWTNRVNGINLSRICHNKIKVNTKGITRGIMNLTISTNNLLINNLTTKVNGDKMKCNPYKWFNQSIKYIKTLESLNILNMITIIEILAQCLQIKIGIRIKTIKTLANNQIKMSLIIILEYMEIISMVETKINMLTQVNLLIFSLKTNW